MILNCVAYENGRKLADIDVEAISDWLQRPDAFVWVALRDPTHEELRTMQEEFDLHDLAVASRHKLAVTPVELAVVTGEAAGGHDHDH